MDLISIIVPIYNVGKYIERCLDSIINQTYQNLEIILVDDGSKDESAKICDEYAEKHSNIVVIHKDNAGLGYARNSGLDVATGTYILFVDGDDYIEKDMVQNLYNDLIKHGADTCIGGFKRVYVNQCIVNKNNFEGFTYENEQIINEVLVKMLGKKQDLTDYIEMSVWKVLFSARIIKENNLRFPSERVFISEDIIFDTDYYKLAKKVYMSGDTGYCYCDNAGSLTTKYRDNRFELQKKLYIELVKRTKSMDIYNLCNQRLITTFVSVSRYCIKLEQKFSNVNGFGQSIKNIKSICCDPVLREALEVYDQSNVPFKSQMVNALILKKKIYMLFGIMYVKNKFSEWKCIMKGHGNLI